jgi:hypothetical protein
MRKSLLLLPFIILPFVFVVGQTSSAQARGWYCEATSHNGVMGWGRSEQRRRAERIALRQCAVRTPRGMMCRLRFCE